jgi:hypothetical protein
MLRVSVMPLLNSMESRTVRLLGTSSDGVPLGAAAESHHDVGGGGGGGGGVGGGGGREAPATARVRHETVSAVSTCTSERSVSPPALRLTLKPPSRMPRNWQWPLTIPDSNVHDDTVTRRQVTSNWGTHRLCGTAGCQ